MEQPRRMAVLVFFLVPTPLRLFRMRVLILSARTSLLFRPKSWRLVLRRALTLARRTSSLLKIDCPLFQGLFPAGNGFPNFVTSLSEHDLQRPVAFFLVESLAPHSTHFPVMRPLAFIRLYTTLQAWHRLVDLLRFFSRAPQSQHMRVTGFGISALSHAL